MRRKKNFNEQVEKGGCPSLSSKYGGKSPGSPRVLARCGMLPSFGCACVSSQMRNFIAPDGVGTLVRFRQFPNQAGTSAVRAVPAIFGPNTAMLASSDPRFSRNVAIGGTT